MRAIVPLLLTCAAAVETKAQGEIAARYSEIVQQYSQALNDSVRKEGIGASGKVRADRATAAFHRELQALIALRDSDDFSPNVVDLIALSESGSRLKDHSLAVVFAKQATSVSENLDAHVALVRSLCACDRLSEAESALLEGTKRFPKAERLYLLHNLLAIAYRRLGQEESAFGHMVQGISLTIKQLDRDQFYLLHLIRCIEQLRELAIANRETRLINCALRWNRELQESIRSRRDDLFTKCVLLSNSDLLAINARHQARVEICTNLSPDGMEESIEDWLATTIATHGLVRHVKAWIEMTNHTLDRIAASLFHDFDGSRTEALLTDLLLLARDTPSDDRQIGEQLWVVSGRIEKAINLVRQHQRHKELLGQRLFDVEDWETLGNSRSVRAMPESCG